MSEKYNTSELFDQIQNPETLRQEVERKLVPLDPSLFEPYKQLAVPIEQVYLSRPDEDYTLRVRASYTPSGEVYTATLKNKGVMTPYGMSRLEIETPIDREAFLRYSADPAYPRVKKVRTELTTGVTIDWIEGVDLPVIEVEDSANRESAAAFYEDYRQAMIDVTGDPAYDNSTIAYEQFAGDFESAGELTAESVVDEMVAQLRTGKERVVIGISGMSGSGKTTLANEVELELLNRFGDSLPAAVRLSTDDYHRGKTWLETTHGQPWTNWDAPEVYDTASLAHDVDLLLAGSTIDKKHFDFEREEAVIDGTLAPAPFILIEGIFAGSPHLARIRDLHFNVPTPIATTVGRDLLRLMHSDRPNNSIGNPEARLRYQLETAIPTYEAQERPRRNTWSGSVRPIGQVALRAQSELADPRQ
jgi:uridine kinase